MNDNLNPYAGQEKQLFKCRILAVAFLAVAALFAILYISELASKVPTPKFSSDKLNELTKDRE